MRYFTIASAALALASAATAEVVHSDIWAYQVDGTLVTGGWDHETGNVVNPSQRVFEGELGEDPSFPFSGDEPGIGSNLVGLTLTMNLSPDLGIWNGAGYDLPFSSMGMLTVSYGGQSASTGSGGSFSFLVTSGLDLHPDFTLSGPGSADPVNGIYLAMFTLSSAGLNTSDAFWVVFNLGSSEEEHEAAVEWAETYLVPAPGAIALLGMAGLMRRRRA